MTLYEPFRACVAPCARCVCAIQAILDRGEPVEAESGYQLDADHWRKTGEKRWVPPKKEAA